MRRVLVLLSTGLQINGGVRDLRRDSTRDACSVKQIQMKEMAELFR